MKHDPRAGCSQRSLRVCVSSSPASVLSMHSQNSPPKHTRETHKSANSQTHTRTKTGPSTNHPSRPRPRQTPSHPSQTKTTPTQHTTPPHHHHHQTHKQKTKKKHKTGTRGNRGEAKERKRREGKKRRRKEKGKNTKRGQGGIEPPTSSTAHAESDVHARSLEIRNASFASEQWVPFLGSQFMISSPARFSPPSVQARERFVQATRSDARPWEKTNLPCCGWKI